MATQKTAATRIDDTINYIARRHPQLATKLRTEVTGQLATDIANTISLQLNTTHMWPDKKDALRAILLLQRYYFAPTRNTWKATSLNHWRTKSRDTIDKAIRLFTSWSDSDAALADVAEANGKAPVDRTADAPYKLSCARGEEFNIGAGICYQALMAWLLKSGLVSFQWFLQHSNVTSARGLRDAIGKSPTIIWGANVPFTAQSRLPAIPRGYIVHFYDRAHESYGHWMVSLGHDGLGVGCNNHPYEGFTDVQYSNQASIDGQFFQRYKQPGQNGIAFMYKPSIIPDRKTLNK